MGDTAILDPLSDEYRHDPAACLARARDVAPLHFLAGVGSWFVVSYREVSELFTHPSFTNDMRAWEHYRTPRPGSVAEWASNTSLFAKTGGEHTRTRRLASHAFTPAAVRRMDEQIAAVCAEHAGRIDATRGEVVDIANRFTRVIPNTVISRVMGVAPLGDDERRFRELASAPIRSANPLLADDERAAVDAAAEELVAYVRAIAEDRRRSPRDDLVTDLVAAYDADDRLSDDEVVLIIFALIAAGTDTTTFASTYGLRSLLRNRDQLALLVERPDLMPNAVLELMRYEVGAGALPRYALDDCEIAGATIRKGQAVFLSLLGAHRDPAVFTAPDRLDLERDTSDVIVFGRGPHYCLGANLAKAELAAIYRQALEIISPDSELIEDAVTYTPPSLMFTTIDALPVRI